MFWVIVSALTAVTVNAGVVLHVKRARGRKSADRFL